MTDSTKTPLALRVENVEKALMGIAPRITSLVPTHVNAERIISSIIVKLGEGGPLAECGIRSIATCALQCAQYGLEPDTPLMQCHLIPFKGQAKLILGYRGLLRLVYNSGEIGRVEAHPVFKGEPYSLVYTQDGFEFRHEPIDEEQLKGDSNLRLFYMQCFFRDAAIPPLVHPILLEAVKKIMAKAPSSGKADSPWRTHFIEMGKKTAIKAGLKAAPLSPEKSRVYLEAVHADNQAEAGKPVNLSGEAREILDTEFEEEPQTESQKMADEQSNNLSPDNLPEDNDG